MSQVDEIKRALDIVQVVGETVDLDTRSRTPKANCPFHAERTPSFVLFPDSQSWRCFGSCATGGDVISFIMKRDDVDFREALQSAAKSAGIELDNKESEKRASASPLIEANEIALGYFWTQLRSAAGSDAQEYLSNRGIDMDAARRRDMGLAPSGMDTLTGHLKTSNVSGKAAAGAGLVVQSADGGWRDMFRGRLTIAIRDAEGRVVGFGGRSLDGSEPKYLNTSRTELFDKSRILYGLNWAEKNIRSSRTAVVVEGYMDVIAAHEHGFENVVASMGTAITSDQVSQVANMADTVILSLDSDSAGQEATLNSLETVWGAFGVSGAGAGRRSRLEIKIARLESGKDPDEAIRNSPNEWQDALNNALPLLRWLMDAYVKRFDPKSPAGKSSITEKLYPLIAAVENPYEQDRYLTELAERLEISIEQLRSNASQIRSTQTRRQSQRRTVTRRPDGGIEFTHGGVAASLEEHLISLVLAYPDLSEFATDLEDELFEDIQNRSLFVLWRTSVTIDKLRTSLTPDLEERLDQITGRTLPPADQPNRVADISECVRRLHERHLRLLKSQEERVLQEMATGDEVDQTRGIVDDNALKTNDRLKNLFARQR
ncbi:MAG: DNA primase [Chloroflexi bacterium]|nr:DNA primase [Chloroflexota bacterium]